MKKNNTENLFKICIALSFTVMLLTVLAVMLIDLDGSIAAPCFGGSGLLTIILGTYGSLVKEYDWCF